MMIQYYDQSVTKISVDHVVENLTFLPIILPCWNAYYILHQQNQMNRSKSIKQGRRIDTIHYDKGKRHFWNNQKRDYGFYQSEEIYDRDQLYKNYSVEPQKRRHSTIGAYQHQRSDEQPEIANNGYGKAIQKLKQHKNLFHISNNIEVKLPAISKVNKLAEASTSKVYEENYSNQYQKQGYPQRYTQGYSSNPTQTLTKRYDYQRIKTEARPAHVYPSHVFSERGRKVRFSPTYVCSLSNPLPTFKLYSSESRKPIYQYGYGKQEAL